MLRGLIAILLVVPTLAAASDPEWTAWFGRMHSFKMVGSEDARNGLYFGVEQARPEPRFHFWGYDADLVLEAYYFMSDGGGFRQWPETTAHNYGLSALGRYYLNREGSTRFYVEGGWGLDYINRLTYDLYSRINSSPVIGVGVVFERGDHDILLSFRLKHLSNAGTAGPNEGENYGVLMLGYRF